MHLPLRSGAEPALREQHRCGFSPGWTIRGYQDFLDLAPFEAAFCFKCHEVRMHGIAVPPALTMQFFHADSRPAQVLLAHFRAAAPQLAFRTRRRTSSLRRVLAPHHMHPSPGRAALLGC
ncbi:hypothetical protein [Streptomyces cadmiisoli]|uniref:hypothetical protein n=1 Tax=Streptomyces cadmiisoli TaxID=2184053 RepID=UPI001FE742EE|nr:hypothetical protein [Streptomyces cadmiisoli]